MKMYEFCKVLRKVRVKNEESDIIFYLQVISLEILIQGAKKNLKISKTVFSRKMAM